LTEIEFSIEGWQAWAPGLETTESWLDWAEAPGSFIDNLNHAPKLDFVTPQQKRRFSQLTKIILQASHECLKKSNLREEDIKDLESVFASRYGEWQQTLGLLGTMQESNELSPAGFSLSVHNTSAGMYSLINKIPAPYTSIAGGKNTFSVGLIEALSRLLAEKDTQSKNVLFVVADEVLPDLYKNTFNFPSQPFALALLLGKSFTKDSRNFRLSQAVSNPVKDSPESALDDIEALSFYKWFLRNNHSKYQKSFALHGLPYSINEV
jgi:hypothetical protein